ncbi:YfcC family protein [Salinicola halimionae]|uniref:YfcC family protein n=1 Tax=Salinicola halimionae TaxID=1949081 RepID=UPI000DA18B5B|nr:AbgT family transporter [Salinicola halimionae]
MAYENDSRASAQALATPGLFRQLFRMPHTYVILIIMVLVAAVMTWLIPAGAFDRVADEASGKQLIVPGSFHAIASTPVGITQIPMAIVEGLIDAADVIFFILIIGGAFQVIRSTGTIDALTGRIAKALGNRGLLVVPVFLGFFSIGGFTMGMSSEVMVFVPIGIAVARSLGFDAITGTAIISLGAACGFTAGLLNPFNVGVAQAIAHVPLFSGMWMRTLLLIAMLVVSSAYIMRYGARVRRDPSRSVVAELEREQCGDRLELLDSLPRLQRRHYSTLLVMVVGFSGLIWGVMAHGWYIKELAALFLTMGIAVGAFAAYRASRIAEEFVAGAKTVLFGALIIGIAHAVLVVFQEGNIIDSVVYYLANVVGELPHVLQIVGMFLFQVIMNVFVTSGTGQAAVTMPIMTPLADLLDISRQSAVLVFQMGDGFTNMILPTSSALMGSLAVSGIPYQKWFRFAMPLIGLWILLGVGFALFATAVGY